MVMLRDDVLHVHCLPAAQVADVALQNTIDQVTKMVLMLYCHVPARSAVFVRVPRIPSDFHT